MPASRALTFPLGHAYSEEFVMKFTWITAALVCIAGINSADAGLFGKHNHGCAAPAPVSCCPAPSCAAPAACAPTCAAPAACAPAACAPTCCAPAPAAPTCCAPAPTSCCSQNYGCCKQKKCRKNWFAGFKGKFKKNRCCSTGCGHVAPTCCAPVAPSCCAPAAAPTCAAPAASCCH